MLTHGLVLGDEFVKIDCLFGNIRRALLIWLEAEGVTTFDHVHRAEAEAKD